MLPSMDVLLDLTRMRTRAGHFGDPAEKEATNALMFSFSTSHQDAVSDCNRRSE